MNYDLCSGTCLKKSGIYSVAMFQKTQIRTYFFLKVRSDFLFVMKSPVSAMVYSASGWRCCEWDKVHKESKRFPALFKRH